MNVLRRKQRIRGVSSDEARQILRLKGKDKVNYEYRYYAQVDRYRVKVSIRLLD
jgi:hypothetical protein